MSAQQQITMDAELTRDILARLGHVEKTLTEMGTRSVGEKVWDWLMKGAVVLSIAAGSALVRNEIVDSKQDLLIAANAEQIKKLPPEWLIQMISEVKQNQKEMAAMLREVEKRLPK